MPQNKNIHCLYKRFYFGAIDFAIHKECVSSRLLNYNLKVKECDARKA